MQCLLRASLGLVLLLAACSATYVAKPVAPHDAQTTRPGIYYMLPRTELLAVLSVSETTERVGQYARDAWAKCEKACLKDAAKSCDALPAGEQTSYEITNVRVHSRVVADPSHLYHVNVDFGTFAAFSHLFKLTNEGVLSSSSSEMENKSVELAINTTKALAKLAVTAGALSQGGPIACATFREAFDLKQEFDAAEDKLRQSLDRVLYASPTPTGPAIEQLIRRHEERVKELRESRRFRQLMADRRAVTETKDLGHFAVKLAPPDYAEEVTVANAWVPIQTLDTEGFAGLESKPADISAVDPVKQRLEALNVVVRVTPAIQFAFDCDHPPASPDAAYLKACPVSSTESVGFRYRVPSAATVVVSKEESGNKQTLGAARTLVAQYGAVVALPAKISGVKSKVALDLYEGTGSPRQLDVGATPQPATLVGDALSPLQDELDRRKKAKDDAQKAAETAEFDALTKQRDILKLKQEIAELEEALNPTDPE